MLCPATLYFPSLYQDYQHYQDYQDYQHYQVKLHKGSYLMRYGQKKQQSSAAVKTVANISSLKDQTLIIASGFYPEKHKPVT